MEQQRRCSFKCLDVDQLSGPLATDSDLGLAWHSQRCSMKDGDGDKVGPSSKLMYVHTSTVATSYYTQVQQQRLTTLKYNSNVLLHTSTVATSYYTQVQQQRLTTHKYSAKLSLHASTVSSWLLHTRTVSSWLLHTSSANLIITRTVFFSILLLIICVCFVYLGGKHAWRGQLKSCLFL